MAYKLNIEFAGMCLFVPKMADAAPARMHVVMPRMDDHTHGERSTDRHVPLLVFDAANLASGNQAPGLVDAFFLLEDFELVLDGTGASISICPDVVDLTPITGKTLLPGVLETDTKKLTAARAKLLVGQMTAVAPGACWEWEPGAGRRRIAHRARWTVEVPGTEENPTLALQLVNYRGGANKTIVLKPLPTSTGGLVLNLLVFHSPPGDLPPKPGGPEKPAYNAPAAHFEGYYRVFPDDVPVRVPLFRSVDGCFPVALPAGGTPDPDRCFIASEMGGSPYTCMVAGIKA